MAWIKRNLIFVIFIAVGLLLTGFCGYLLYNAIAANAVANDDYQTKLNALKDFEQKPVSPSKENIQAAKADEERLRKFLESFHKSFSPFPVPPAEDEKGFQTYLEHTLVRFRMDATNAGVLVAPEYAFSFSGLMGKLTYPPANIAPWMQQLQEINAILDILYTAKVNNLIDLKRVPVSPDEASSQDCLPVSSVTNQWGVVTPYKIQLHCFSAELAAVLDGFARSSHCFIVKSLEVDNEKGGTATPQSGAAPSMIESQPAMQFSMPQSPRGRPGGLAGFLQPNAGRAPAPMPTAPAQVRTTPALSTAPVTVLTESLLTVTISVDVIKLNTAEPK